MIVHSNRENVGIKISHAIPKSTYIYDYKTIIKQVPGRKSLSYTNLVLSRSHTSVAMMY